MSHDLFYRVSISAEGASYDLSQDLSSFTIEEDGTTPADPFDYGSGHIVPGGKANKGSVFEPGLVYDAGFFEYLGFLCDASPGTLADPVGLCAFLDSMGIPTDASDLNIASIAVGELVGTQTVTRAVTSVAKENGWRTYDVSVDAPSGFDVTVSPSTNMTYSPRLFRYPI